MLRDITLGQYYPGNSWIHKLDPRVKIIATLLFIVELFVVNNYVGFLVAILAIAVVIGISKVPVSYIFRGMKPIIIIMIFTFIMNIFLVDGRVLWHWWIFTITYEGLTIGIFLVIRLALLIAGTSLLTFTTKPMALTDAIEKLLGPIGKLGAPIHEVAMMMTIAIRFIPTLLEESDKIIKAQQARGADFESGNIFRRGKSLIPIIIPLFISAFRIAQDLAYAMEARCYKGGEGRTRLHELKFEKRDIACFIIIFLYLGLIIGTRFIPGI